MSSSLTDPVRVAAASLTGPIAHHAEGPVWAEEWGGLRFVDLDAGAILTLRADGVSRLQLDEPIAAFVRPRRSGGYVVAVERGIALADSVDGFPVRRVDCWAETDVRMNDGTVDPDGRLLAGGMAYDARPGASALYRFDADLRMEVVVPDVTVSNGIDFSPDGSRGYFVDSLTHRIDVFDYRCGELENRRGFVEIEPAEGLPDGLGVSADGSVWVALWGGGAVHGYSPDGRLHTIVELPVTQVSACVFGGADLDILFITTSRQGLGDGDEPEAGGVFAARTGHRGMPVRRFAG